VAVCRGAVPLNSPNSDHDNGLPGGRAVLKTLLASSAAFRVTPNYVS